MVDTPSDFTMNEFLKQMDAMQRLGTMQDILRMIPGMKGLDLQVKDTTAEMRRIKGMIQAMTPAERADGSLMNPPRLERIAKGSGTKPEDVSRFIADFYQIRIMMRKIAILKMRPEMD